MQAWITLEEALKRDPEFLDGKGENAWTYDPNRHGFYSRFGFAEVRVQLDSDGNPAFDRVVVGEGANVNVVAHALDSKGIRRILVVFQERPFADNPDGSPADPPIVFAQPCVMAFNVDGVESIIETVLRELLEEGGVSPKALIGDAVEMGAHSPNPTFCATWSNLFEVEVDLSKVTLPTDTEERITGTAWLPVKDLLSRIAQGEHEGINYRSATANDALMIWLAQNLDALID